MNYTQKKAQEICYIVGVIEHSIPENDYERKIVSIMENRIKEIIRDVRHRAAETVTQFQNGFSHDRAKTDISNAVMNMDMDKE